ncbi:MAG: PhzF family phenazine biosynthesis protein [candidate division Zixibacteria bacterium]|nr:PhzF family phenazine biosynthesis protein [candidate division Zixibacteria bacterium]
MKIPIYQVDAFTSKLFGGNPAAVCPLEQWLDMELMQNIAAENNLSETAFFVPRGDHFELKWFTPRVEINLCGHATLASSHVIFNHLGHKGDTIEFQTLSGKLVASRDRDLISLNFPAYHAAPAEMPHGLPESLKKEPQQVFKARDFLALFGDEDDILTMDPDFEKMKHVDSHGIIVTAPGKKCDFVSRFFAPGLGINEDPVTGSAHSMLIPFWAERLNKKSLHAIQLSQRKGELFCEYLGERVKMSGRAVTFFVGEILL